MKKLSLFTALVTLSCVLLCSCAGKEGPSPSPEDTRALAKVSHAEFMVSDEKNLYYCPAAPTENYDTYFGASGDETDTFVCSLRRIAAADIFEQPTKETVLAEKNCHWLCLHNDLLYFAVQDEGTIYRVPTSGGNIEPIYTAEGAYGLLKNLNSDGAYLYFEEEDILKRIPLDGSDRTPEVVFEANDALVQAMKEWHIPCGDDFCLYGFEILNESLYLTVESMAYCCLLCIDLSSESFSYKVLCGSTAPDICLCNGKLYYLKTDEAHSFRESSLSLMFFDGEEAYLAGASPDIFGLSVCGNTLYYCKYTADAGGTEKKALLCSYSEGAGEKEIPTPSEIKYIMGVSENMIWYENEAVNVWMTNEKSIEMSTKGEARVTPSPEPTEIPEQTQSPTSVPAYGPGTSYLKIRANELSACYRLVRTDGSEEFCVLLKPGEARTMSFPCGRYVLKIAEGKTWISDTEAFGEDGRYSSTNVFYFAEGSTYRIGAGTTGDFYQQGPSGFLG